MITGHRTGRLAALLLLAGAIAQPGFAEPKRDASGTPSALSARNTQQPACASDGSRLGLSRVVEIDSSKGGDFGGSHGGRIDFLQDKEVVLTFDDGPLRPYTTAVLEALAKHCTKATFFMVGRMAVADPDMVKRVANEGHTVASHTWSHKDLGKGSSQRGIDEIEKGVTAITKSLGGPIAPFFRFPYLSPNAAVQKHLKARGISAWWIDVDSVDYRTRNADVVHNRVMSRLKKAGKGIILMHDIQRSTAGAMDGLLDDLHKNGFKVVHLVPALDGTTVAGYEATIDKALAKKTKAASDAPLARRAVTWSADPPAASGEVLPWSTDAAPAAKAPPARSPARRPEERAPAAKPEPFVTWEQQIFGY